jgi:ABC-type uncharacterized transport system auxiliary subunit
MNRFSLLFLMIAMIFTACRGGKQVVNRYYLLEYPMELVEAEMEGLRSVPGSLGIDVVFVNHAFASRQIALREETHEIRYFSHNEWAVRPYQSLTELVEQFFRHYHVFDRLVPPLTTEVADFSLQTAVHQLEVVKYRNRFQARISLDFRLVDNQTGNVVLSHHADASRDLQDRNLNLFAKTISELFITELQVFVQQISQHGF